MDLSGKTVLVYVLTECVCIQKPGSVIPRQLGHIRGDDLTDRVGAPPCAPRLHSRGSMAHGGVGRIGGARTPCHSLFLLYQALFLFIRIAGQPN